MKNVYQLLSIPEAFHKEFASYAKDVPDQTTRKAVEARIIFLTNLADEVEDATMSRVPEKTVEHVLSRVINAARAASHKGEKWTVRNLRIIAYNVRRLQGDMTAFSYALDLLGSQWKDSFFRGLVFSLLNNWLELKPNYSIKLRTLIIQRLTVCESHSGRYQLLRDNFNLIEEDGTFRMAALLIQLKTDILEAPAILGFRQSSLAWSYYSDVILHYLERSGVADWDILGRVLEYHGLDRTRKLGMAHFVEFAEKYGNDIYKQYLGEFAHNILGDITLAASWCPFKGATELDIDRLRNAKNLANKWYTQKVVEVFFEICVKDAERKAYWLGHVDHINDFRIVGYRTVRERLRRDPRIASVVDSHFITAYYKQTTALVLCLKDRVIMEFSNKGWALSAFRHGHPQIAVFDSDVKKIYHKLDEFKLSFPSLVDKDWMGSYTYLSEEGKMNHQGFWQERLDRWIREKVIMSNAQPQSFGSPDDEVFKKEIVEPEIEYVDNIRFTLYSKFIGIRNRYRVVAANNGYYLHFESSMRYAFLHKYEEGERLLGALLLRPQPDGWCCIMHVFRTEDSTKRQEIVVCYLKREGQKVLCKDYSEPEKVITYKI